MREGRPSRVGILMTSELAFLHIGQYFAFSIHVHVLGYTGTAFIAAACIGIGVINGTKPNEERPHENVNTNEEDIGLLKDNHSE